MENSLCLSTVTQATKNKHDAGFLLLQVAPTHTHALTQCLVTHINTGLCSLVSNYNDNWGVHHAGQRLVNIFNGYSINRFIAKQQQKPPHPSPPNLWLTNTHHYRGTHTQTLTHCPFKWNGAGLIWRVFDRQHFNDPEPWWGLKLTETSIGASVMSGRKTLNSQICIYGLGDVLL